MTLTTSTQFASAIASGNDWRDTSKAILEQLERIRTQDDNFNIGFLYVSDYLADDLTSILNLFRSVLDIETWSGCVAIGVCGNGQEYINKPAISAMIGYIDEKDFCPFPGIGQYQEEPASHFQAWLEENDPLVIYTHGDPIMDNGHDASLQHLDHLTGGYIVGGFSSSRTQNSQISGHELYEQDICGVAFSQNLPMASMISQGCHPLSETHTITKARNHDVCEINDTKALDIFENEIRNITVKRQSAHKQCHNPKNIQIIHSGQIDVHQTADQKTLDQFQAEILAAFPVAESDQAEYMVRDILSIDEKEGSINIGQSFDTGDRIMFVYRDDESAKNDLSEKVMKMRARILKEHGVFAPKAGLYVSCIARSDTDFSYHDKDPNTEQDQDRFESGEMKRIQDIIGDVPLTGYYGAGEIHAGRIYTYASILILFL